MVQQVVNRSRCLSHLFVEKSSPWGAEVRDNKTGRRHVVNTELHDCTCLEWQHTGKPCEHAILFLASQPKINMHPYLHEYYSVARFKAAYATPIPALTDQSQWPKVDIEFSMCPPLTKRKAGRPKQSRFKAWFEKGGSSKKGKKDGKPKRAQKVTKTDASCARNLGTEWDLSNAVTLLISQSMFLFICLCFDLVLFSNYYIYNIFPMARRKRAIQPLVVEQCWPTKKARVNGGRKKRSVPEPEQTEENLAAVNIQTEETALEVETEPERVEVQTEETHVEVHTEETETAVNIETADTDHEGVGEVLKRPVKKTKMISELVCVVEPKTRSAKAKKGTRRGRKR